MRPRQREGRVGTAQHSRAPFAVALAVAFAVTCSARTGTASDAGPARPPVVLVHGIWDSGAVFDRMSEKLRATGAPEVLAIDLEPNDGGEALASLARQLEDAVVRLQARTHAPRVDVVGFSMGSLVARWWLARYGGAGRTRRFISLAGPQHGTLTAWFSWKTGARDMRPGSVFLQALEADAHGFGEVEVSSYWTPFDLMILPASSGVLPGAREQRFLVGLHGWMTTDEGVLAAITTELAR